MSSMQCLCRYPSPWVSMELSSFPQQATAAALCSPSLAPQHPLPDGGRPLVAWAKGALQLHAGPSKARLSQGAVRDVPLEHSAVRTACGARNDGWSEVVWP